MSRTPEGDALLCQETEDPSRIQTSVLEDDMNRTAEGDMTAEGDALLCQDTTTVLEEDMSGSAEEDALLQETEDSPRIQAFHRTRCTCGLRLQLLLYRGSFFLAGIVLLVAGGVTSQHLHYPLADSTMYDNCSNSSGAAL